MIIITSPGNVLVDPRELGSQIVDGESSVEIEKALPLTIAASRVAARLQPVGSRPSTLPEGFEDSGMLLEATSVGGDPGSITWVHMHPAFYDSPVITASFGARNFLRREGGFYDLPPRQAMASNASQTKQDKRVLHVGHRGVGGTLKVQWRRPGEAIRMDDHALERARAARRASERFFHTWNNMASAARLQLVNAFWRQPCPSTVNFRAPDPAQVVEERGDGSAKESPAPTGTSQTPGNLQAELGGLVAVLREAVRRPATAVDDARDIDKKERLELRKRLTVNMGQSEREFWRMWLGDDIKRLNHVML
jgi:hypothetical protein